MMPSRSYRNGRTVISVAIILHSLAQFSLLDNKIELLHAGDVGGASGPGKRRLREFVSCSTTQSLREPRRQESTSDIKPCALLFFGLAKQFRGVVLPSIREHILGVSENGKCDIYVHNYNITSISNPRTGEIDNTVDPTEVFDLTSNVVMDTREEFFAKRNMGYYAGPEMLPRKTLGWDQVALENMYKQWHSIERVWDLMEENEQRRGIEYERVGLFRSDVQYVTPIDIFDGDAVIPSFGFLVNDRMFYGTYENAHIWAKSRYPSVPCYTPRHPWIKMHSEFFLNDFVLKHIPNVTKKDNLCFYRVRANGDIWDDDCRRKYRFPQFLVDANLTYS